MTQALLSSDIDILKFKFAYDSCHSAHPGCYVFKSAYIKANKIKAEKERKERDEYFKKLEEKKNLENEQLIASLQRACAEKK